MAEQPVYKIMLLGNAGVGKSSLVHRFADNTFNGTYTATIGIDFKTRAVELDGQRIKLQIWDTAGQERCAHCAPFWLPVVLMVCTDTAILLQVCRLSWFVALTAHSVLQRSGRRCTCI
eukprot:TRINITY_DN1624_c0_g1_i1.p1 TRINITY_DN1624_c0_g1~~TRINITY_DN1624_c0_g1_i1.p1  ORF type:complete len:118 (-),score=1.74 TRINITY_DN1624_c0_g1_i1:520-873(-)